MKIIAILAVLVCCVLMFVVKRPYKAGILMLSAMLFTPVQVTFFPIHTGTLLIVLSFLLSEVGHFRQLFRESRGTIVWQLTGLAIFAYILTIIFSPHLKTANEIRIFTQTELLLTHFALIYAFWCYTDEESFKPTLNITFWGLIVLTAFGVLNYLTKSADWLSDMLAGTESSGVVGEDIGTQYTYSDRFRVQAMFSNAFNYGYICIIVFLLHLYGYLRKMENGRIFLTVLVCSLFGVVTCGCRTNVFCFIIGLIVFVMSAFKMGKSLRYAMILLLVLGLSYSFVPAVQEKIDNMASMFDKKSEVEGSSIEMRTLQFAAVLYHIKDSPVVGRGQGFFNIDMGWGKGKKYLIDDRLWGLEGVAMNRLLERGFLGLAMYMIFYGAMIVYLFKNRKRSRMLTALGLALLAVYLSFANMTGELLSVYPTLLATGFVIKAVGGGILIALITSLLFRRSNTVLSLIPRKALNIAWI